MAFEHRVLKRPSLFKKRGCVQFSRIAEAYARSDHFLSGEFMGKGGCETELFRLVLAF